MYDTWVKCLRKWVKKCKIGHFGVKWPNSAKKDIFCIFWPIFPNIWPKCHTPLESVKFFWLFETLKSKIHFFHQKFYKGSPLWILGEMSATMKASGVTSHYFREKISSQFILVLWMSRKTSEPKIFENFSIFHFTLMANEQWDWCCFKMVDQPGRKYCPDLELKLYLGLRSYTPAFNLSYFSTFLT